MSHIIRDNLRSLPDVQKLIVDNFNRLPELQQKVRDHYLNERPVLRHYNAMPKWLLDNKFLLTGYRPELHSVRRVIQSLFYIHNETGNIYSHGLGALVWDGNDRLDFAYSAVLLRADVLHVHQRDPRPPLFCKTLTAHLIVLTCAGAICLCAFLHRRDDLPHVLDDLPSLLLPCAQSQHVLPLVHTALDSSLITTDIKQP